MFEITGHLTINLGGNMPEVRIGVDDSTDKFVVIAGDIVVASNIATKQEADAYAECVRCKMEIS